MSWSPVVPGTVFGNPIPMSISRSFASPTLGSMTLETLPSWAGELIVNERVARLAFADDDDHPRVLPVTFALVAERGLERDRRQAETNLRAGAGSLAAPAPGGPLFIDHYDDDWSQLAWVQLPGGSRCSSSPPGRPGSTR